MQKRSLATFTLASALLAFGCGNDNDGFNDVVLAPTATLSTLTTTTRTNSNSTTATTTSNTVTSNSVTTTSTTAPSTNRLLAGLNSSNQLVFFNSDAPATILRTITVNGIPAGETLQAVDFRPQTNGFYAVSRSTTNLNVYYVSLGNLNSTATTGTANATQVATLAVDQATLPDGTAIDADFNPVADALRIVTANGLNYVANVSADGITTLTAGSAIPTGSSVSGIAYTNNQQNSGPTTNPVTLYSLDSTSDTLNVQNPASSAQSNQLPVGVNFTSVAGFDIPAGINVATSNTVASGTAYAALNTGTGSTAATNLYTIDLASGAATSKGAITGLRSLTVVPDLNNAPLVGIGGAVGGTQQLYRFQALDTVTVPTATDVTGLTAGETLVGADYRPSNGKLYGLGYNFTNDSYHLYVVNPQTGVATAVANPATPLGVTAAAAPLLTTTGFGVDFDPITDALRVTVGANVNLGIIAQNNLSIDPSTSGVIGGTAISDGTNPESASGLAFSNNYTAGATFAQGWTIDDSNDTLNYFNPATGIQTEVGDFSGTLDIGGLNGFYIPRTVATVNTAGAAPLLDTGSTNLGYVLAAIPNTTTSGFYALNLATGGLVQVRAFAAPLYGLAGL